MQQELRSNFLWDEKEMRCLARGAEVKLEQAPARAVMDIM